MGAIIKTTDQKIQETIEATAKRVTESVMEKLNAEKHNVERIEPVSPVVNNSGSKVSQILRNANLQQSNPVDFDKERVELNAETERIRKDLADQREKLEREKAELKKHDHNHEEDTLDCPTCSKKNGTSHVLKSIGNGKVACTGPNCGIEYNLIPSKAEYKCTNCGVPHAKPTEIDDNDECPLCKNKDFLKYDWSKILKTSKK
jgi:DNA-directed RNA polymerase subunit RPC12/RpoP